MSSLPLKSFFVVLTLVLVAISFDDLVPKINRIELSSIDRKVNDGNLRTALLSDLHIVNDPQSLRNIETLWEDVVAAAPDIIMLAGDYVNNGGAGEDITLHRQAVAKVLGRTEGIPIVAVLGNHEQWSDSMLWAQAFDDAGIIVLENKVAVMADLNLCVRGFSDAFTQQFSYLDFPEACEGRVLFDPPG